MSAPAKKAAIAVTLMFLATVMTAACAFAQAGPGNPTGGSSLRVATEEGRGSLSTVSLFSRQLSLPVTWQVAFGSFIASQVASNAPRSTDGRAQVWAARRPSARK